MLTFWCCTCTTIGNDLYVLFHPEPCVPLNLRVHYSMSVAQLHWNSTRGAVNFTAEAVTPQGLNGSCSTNTTSCAISGMACGQVYNITVTAHNQVCQDTSQVYTLMTGEGQMWGDCSLMTGKMCLFTDEGIHVNTKININVGINCLRWHWENMFHAFNILQRLQLCIIVCNPQTYRLYIDHEWW